MAHENSVEELASPQSAVVRAVLRGIESIGSGVPIDAVATVVEIIDGTFVGKKLALATVTRSGGSHRRGQVETELFSILY